METNSKQLKLSVRRSTKQVMERQRRARINSSLNQIRKLVLQGLNKDPGCFEKLEKADILELTVRYLKSLKCSSAPVSEDENSRQSCSSSSSCSSGCSHAGNSVCSKYRTGYLECLDAVQKYIEVACPSLNRDTKWRITRHLQSRRFDSNVHFQRCDCFINEHRRVIMPCALHCDTSQHQCPSPLHSSGFSDVSYSDCVDGRDVDVDMDATPSSASSLSPAADSFQKNDSQSFLPIWRPW